MKVISVLAIEGKAAFSGCDLDLLGTFMQSVMEYFSTRSYIIKTKQKQDMVEYDPISISRSHSFLRCVKFGYNDTMVLMTSIKLARDIILKASLSCAKLIMPQFQLNVTNLLSALALLG